MKNDNLVIMLAAIALFILVMPAVLGANGPQVKFYNPSPANNSLVYNGAITVNASTDEDVSEINVYLLDAQGDLVSGVGIQNNSIVTSFQNLSDSIYSFYAEATYSDGTTLKSKTIYFENINAPFMMIDSAPANGSILRVNETNVSASTNRNTTYFDIVLLNESGNIVDISSAAGNRSNQKIFSLSDGWYTLYATAQLRERNGTTIQNIAENGTYLNFTTENITFYVDSHVPELSNVSISQALQNITDTGSATYTINFMTNENVTASIVLRNGTSAITVFNASFANASNSFSFSLSNLIAGNYSAFIALMDSAGNVNRTALGNFTVSATPAPSPGNTGGGGGGGGSIGGFVPNVAPSNNSINFTSLANNNTNMSLPNEEEPTEERRGFFNAITGAVTGALGRPGIRFAIYFIAVLIALFIAIRLREQFLTGAEPTKKKAD